MDMCIKICEKNRNEIAKLIEETEKRCSVRCFGSIEHFEREFSKFTTAYGNLPKSAMVGCVVEFRAYCKQFPRAYKYTPETTMITVEFKKSGCYITSIERVNANCSSRHEREITFMPETMKNRIMENAHYFRCSHHERA